MEEFEEIMEAQSDLKKLLDKLNIYYFFDEDVEVCDYVSRQLVGFNVDDVNYGKQIPVKETIQKSLDEMKIFGDDVGNKICSSISEIPIDCISCGKEQFGIAVSYEYDDNDMVITDSGVVNRYVIPKDLYELSVYHFSHEHIHSLKETNYSEHRNCMVLGETIPLFYELMIYDPNELLKKELLKFRMYWLLNNKEEYLLFNALYEDSYMHDFFNGKSEDRKTELYEFVRSRIGCYLNSFYYALILYSMYKETPQRILDLVSKVLKQEMTTLEILEILGVYGDIKGEVFEKELGQIKRILK